MTSQKPHYSSFSHLRFWFLVVIVQLFLIGGYLGLTKFQLFIPFQNSPIIHKGESLTILGCQFDNYPMNQHPQQGLSDCVLSLKTKQHIQQHLLFPNIGIGEQLKITIYYPPSFDSLSKKPDNQNKNTHLQNNLSKLKGLNLPLGVLTVKQSENSPEQFVTISSGHHSTEDFFIPLQDTSADLLLKILSTSQKLDIVKIVLTR